MSDRSQARFIAGDWGTSNLRLYLCDAQGQVLETVTGPGASACSGRFETTLSELSADWHPAARPLPTVLCGMVGSTIGWVEARYLPCPTPLDSLAESAVRLAGGLVAIVAGLSCRNPLGAPDVMRGEETQIVGALALHPQLRSGRQLLCLPGTHTKWALVNDGVVEHFLTAATGELFALISRHSVLVREAAASGDDTFFEAAVARMHEPSAPTLSHVLFECRSRMLFKELPADKSADYLSGLLIADDVRGAMQIFSREAAVAGVTVIGAPLVAQRYASALSRHPVNIQGVEGAQASLAGLTRVHQQLFEGVAS